MIGRHGLSRKGKPRARGMHACRHGLPLRGKPSHPSGARFAGVEYNRVMRLVIPFALVMIVWLLSASAAPPTRPGTPAPPATSKRPEAQPKILVFSRTAGFRHESIPAGIEAIKKLGEQNAISVDATEDSAAFTDDNLRRYRAVIFLNTTGDVLDDEQQAAFERYIRAGHGFVGVHSATDTEYDWPWYGRLVGAYFAGHPKEIQQATIRVVDRTHPSTKHLGETWQRTDEWYNFKQSPAKTLEGKVRLLATLDESTYEGGTMSGDHPIAWCHEFDGGRAWYTAGGHTIESYSEEAFLKHLLGGIQWAMQVKE
jgi:cytochrome c